MIFFTFAIIGVEKLNLIDFFKSEIKKILFNPNWSLRSRKIPLSSENSTLNSETVLGTNTMICFTLRSPWNCNSFCSDIFWTFLRFWLQKSAFVTPKRIENRRSSNDCKKLLFILPSPFFKHCYQATVCSGTALTVLELPQLGSFKSKNLIFGYSEKALKIWNNIPLCFDSTTVESQSVDLSKILRPKIYCFSKGHRIK